MCIGDLLIRHQGLFVVGCDGSSARIKSPEAKNGQAMSASGIRSISIPTLNTMICLVQGRALAVLFFSLRDLIHDHVVSLLASGNQHEWVKMVSCYTP
jgi:hypothetical protein